MSAVDCKTCGRLSCVCATVAMHAEDCPHRRATTCSTAIECDHGYDACPICDPCTCEDQ
jgi:hypothetical protein